MKKIILITILMFLSCTSPIERQYNIKSEYEDLNKINKNLASDDYEILKWQLTFLKSHNNVKKTYSEILSEGKVRWNDTLKKKESDRKKERERVKKEEEESKKELAALICNRKWGIHYYKPNYLEVNPELSEKDKKIAETAFKWNPKNNWIIFNEDGTCKIKEEESNKIYKKYWHLNDKREIILPSGWQYEKLSILMAKVTFQIIDLNDETLNVTEFEKSTNITIVSEMKMKKIK